MANGAAVAKLVPSSTSANPSAIDQEEIKIALGQALADATEALGAGLADLDAGGLTDANRTRGGETVARVVELQLATLGEMPDFAGVALAEGRRTLLARHGATLRLHLGTDAGIDDVFGEHHILAVANKVTAIEMAFRAN